MHYDKQITKNEVDNRMKIAINSCYGGFSLSNRVFERMIELGFPYYENSKEVPEDFKGHYIVKTRSGMFNDYYLTYKNLDYDDYYSVRVDPILIRAIEELKSEASTRVSEIKIIEIPDDVEWDIDEYDGIESVHEKHQSWG